MDLRNSEKLFTLHSNFLRAEHDKELDSVVDSSNFRRLSEQRFLEMTKLPLVYSSLWPKKGAELSAAKVQPIESEVDEINNLYDNY